MKEIVPPCASPWNGIERRTRTHTRVAYTPGLHPTYTLEFASVWGFFLDKLGPIYSQTQAISSDFAGMTARYSVGANAITHDCAERRIRERMASRWPQTSSPGGTRIRASGGSRSMSHI